MINCNYNNKCSSLLFFLLITFRLIGFHFVLSDEFLANSTGIPSTSSDQKQQQQFWISTSVEQIRFRKECISTQLCAEPRFSLINQMPKFNERLSRDWSITKAEVPGISLEFFTFWARGAPSDVTIQALVHGIDPKFKFSRICDESSFVSVFQFVSKSNDHKKEEGNEKIQLELHAQCFNTTLTVELFRHRCPWCLSEDAQQKEMAHLMDTSPPFLCQFPLQFRTNLLIVLLAVATGINVLAFIGLLLICERQRRNGRNNYEREKQDQNKDSQKWAGQIVFHRTQQNHPPFINTKNRLQATRTQPQQLLPTISEEFYEVIDEETAAEPRPNVLPPPHFNHKTSATFQRQPKMVQLPLSNKCDHCFLRVQGDDRCSCGSLDTSIESNFGNSFSADENEENFNELAAHSSFNNNNNNENTLNSSNNAIDSGLDGSNHTEEEKT
ncbi:hypothetical protein niasHT_035704 [Heterodera trifolii]|uniref:C2 domain-containing protein n=1 Tax=Heterodera trifolii TaxID=157864 RepID=A0ABD2HVX5_9BILA